MRKISKILNGMAAAAGYFILLFAVSCNSVKDNSDRSLAELASHMTAQVGGTLDGKVFTPPVKAADGVSIRVEGREVFLYQYDLTLKKQQHKLDQIRKSGMLYINGIPFKAAVNGCFVMIEHETNIKKKELLHAFENF